jgi:hypothetical protein
MKFALMLGHVVTAEDDGSVSLNARIVCKATEVHQTLMTTLLAQANMLHESPQEVECRGNDPLCARRNPPQEP